MWAWLKDIHWGELGAFVAVWTALTTVLIFLLRPLLDRLFVAAFARNEIHIKTVLISWFEVTKQREVFAKLQLDHSDLYKRFGEVLVANEKEFSDLAGRVEEAIKQQTSALKDISEASEATARSVAHIYGIMNTEPWDGRTERRSRDRRA